MIESIDQAGEAARRDFRRELAGAADWIGLAAAPAFAVMALVTAASSGAQTTCLTVQDALPLDGMVAMYLLMGAFHLPPWLRLIAGRRGSAHQA